MIRDLDRFSNDFSAINDLFSMDRVVKIQVPGKVIIAGEHAVVYGKQALATSIGLSVRVTVSKLKLGEKLRVDKNDEKGLVKKAIELAGGNKDLDIQIESELPVGSGLGSSAAVSVAVIKGVKNYLSNPITDDELFKLAFECEKIAHGNPSGLDPATIVYRGLIAYIKNQPFERLLLNKPVKLLLVNTGKPSESTKEMVEIVANNPHKDKIINKIGDLVEKVRHSLINGADVGELLNENGLLLEELGVVGELAKKISKELRELGCNVKITGAGGVKTGSGMMIVLCEDFAKIKKLLDNSQIKYLETIIGGK